MLTRPKYYVPSIVVGRSPQQKPNNTQLPSVDSDDDVDLCLVSVSSNFPQPKVAAEEGGKNQSRLCLERERERKRWFLAPR